MLVNHWIDGKPWDGAPIGRSPIHDPARGAIVGEVLIGSASDVDEAVESAARAWPAWRDTSLTRRQQILFAYRELLVTPRDELARLVTAQHGKTLADASGEVQRGIEVVEFACNIPHLMKGEFSEQVSTGIDTYTLRQPLGVCAGITPFNFPAMVRCGCSRWRSLRGTRSSSNHQRRTLRLQSDSLNCSGRPACHPGSST